MFSYLNSNLAVWSDQDIMFHYDDQTRILTIKLFSETLSVSLKDYSYHVLRLFKSWSNGNYKLELKQFTEEEKIINLWDDHSISKECVDDINVWFNKWPAKAYLDFDIFLWTNFDMPHKDSSIVYDIWSTNLGVPMQKHNKCQVEMKLLTNLQDPDYSDGRELIEKELERLRNDEIKENLVIDVGEDETLFVIHQDKHFILYHTRKSKNNKFKIVELYRWFVHQDKSLLSLKPHDIQDNIDSINTWLNNLIKYGYISSFNRTRVLAKREKQLAKREKRLAEKKNKLENEKNNKLENEKNNKLENEKNNKLENEKKNKLENEKNNKLENEKNNKLEKSYFILNPATITTNPEIVTLGYVQLTPLSDIIHLCTPDSPCDECCKPEFKLDMYNEPSDDNILCSFCYMGFRMKYDFSTHIVYINNDTTSKIFIGAPGNFHQFKLIYEYKPDSTYVFKFVARRNDIVIGRVILLGISKDLAVPIIRFISWFCKNITDYHSHVLSLLSDNVNSDSSLAASSSSSSSSLSTNSSTNSETDTDKKIHVLSGTILTTEETIEMLKSSGYGETIMQYSPVIN